MRAAGLPGGLPLALAAALAAGCDGTGPGGEDGPWQLVWSDEFEGPAGQLPDPAKWTFDIGTDWGNAQLEYDTDRPENVSLDGGGSLAITARREFHQGSNYTSGRIKTEGRFEQAFGRFEARIQLPTGRGIWPAFWMLGADFAAVGWPACGEIDVMEYRGQEPNVVLGTVHGPGYSGGGGVGARYVLQGRTLRLGLPRLRRRVERGADRLVRRRRAVPPGGP